MQRGQKLDKLEEGQELGGVVTGVRNFGAFVDVGAESDGLLHVRHINDGIVGKLDTIMRHGDPLVVKVIAVRAGKLELGLVSPLPRLPKVDGFLNVKEDEWISGTVVALMKFGSVLEVTSPKDGTKMDAFLGLRHSKSGSMLGFGDVIQARILKVDTEKRQVLLTQKEDEKDLTTR